MAKLLKEPLLHFILAGFALFLFFKPEQSSTEAVATQPVTVDTTIIVDRQALLDYMQFQAKAFDEDSFNAKLDAMSADERTALINHYVREEALYREALSMHMDEGDYIIKQRMVQKVEFLLENLVANTSNPTEEQLNDFYQRHQSDYQVDAVYSFTHLFFDAENGGKEAALARAKAQQARTANIGFNDAVQYSERFPFLQNYVERTREFVVSNFSEDFVAALDTLTPSDNTWHGPIASRYGHHLVMLVNKTPPTLPALVEIRERVLEDYRYESLQQNREKAEQDVVANYQVRVQLERE